MPGIHGFRPSLLLSFIAISFLLTGCASEGDLGRPQHNYWSRNASDFLERARVAADMREDPDLPLTAAEDALRQGKRDLAQLENSGITAVANRWRGGDEFDRVRELVEDINVEREKFEAFVVAARRVITIDEMRERRLRDLSALETRRQRRAVSHRRHENNVIIRRGVREMRLRFKRIRRFIARLSVEAPSVPMDGPEEALERLSDVVVEFHAEQDHRAFTRLGRHKPYK